MPAPKQPQMMEVETKVERPNKPEWHCEVSRQVDPQTPLTVGEVVALNCSGPELSLKQPLRIELPEKFEYSLVLLKPLEVSNTKITYEATHYRAGKMELPFLNVVDANNGGFVSQPMNFNVQSVIGQPPPEKIYGGYGPMPMGWPVWIFFALMIFVMVLLGWAAIFLKTRIQKKNLEKNIRKFLSPMGSYHQFSKDVRVLRSRHLFSERHEWSQPQVQNYIFDLDEHFRMFLLREFTVPATSWSSRQTQAAIKKKARMTYPYFRDALRSALQELDRARSNYEGMTSKDCDHLTKIIVKAVDSIWAYKYKGNIT